MKKSTKNGHTARNAIIIRPVQAGTVSNGALGPVTPSREIAVLIAEVARMRKEMALFSIRIDTDPITALDQKRDLLEKASEIADTMGFHLLRSIVEVLHEKHCPESDLR